TRCLNFSNIRLTSLLVHVPDRVLPAPFARDASVIHGIVPGHPVHNEQIRIPSRGERERNRPPAVLSSLQMVNRSIPAVERTDQDDGVAPGNPPAVQSEDNLLQTLAVRWSQYRAPHGSLQRRSSAPSTYIPI